MDLDVPYRRDGGEPFGSLDVDRRVIAHGQSAIVSPDNGQIPKEILRWRDPRGLSWPVSITMFVRPDSDVPVGAGGVLPEIGRHAVAELRASIQWGSGGTQSQVVCDLIRGMTLSIAGSWVSVGALYLGYFGLAVQPTMVVGAHLSEGTHVHIPPPRLTERIPGPIAPGLGGQVSIPIPPYAWQVRPRVPYPPVPGGISLEQLDAVGTVLSRYNYGDTEQNSSEILDNSARIIRFTNGFPGPLPFASLLFDLAI